MATELKTRIVKLGQVGVDSGQLIICDPSYIESEFKNPDSNGQADHGHDVYQHVDDGKLWQFTYGAKPQWGVSDFPGTYDIIIPEYGLSPNDLITAGKFIKAPIDPRPHIQDGEFSYRGICKVAGDDDKQGGQLNYSMGHAGVAVVFRTGMGDGTYDVFAELVQTEHFGERVKKIWVEFLPHPYFKDDEEMTNHLLGKLGGKP